MEGRIPPVFDETFLDWFRLRTEAVWSMYPTPTLQRFQERRRLGCEWQPGTRWLGGLEEEQLAAVEHAWAWRFPPDYRLFLRRLHAVDRPLRCTAWTKVAGAPDELILQDAPAFSNWLSDGDILRRRLDDLVTGLQFDVEKNGLWPVTWGVRPATTEARAERVRELVAAAPRLIPVFSHRYLLAEPCQAGNPVFSIVQSDIVVYGADLRTYFLAECADLLGITQAEVRGHVTALRHGQMPTYAAIPFWGQLLAR